MLQPPVSGLAITLGPITVAIDPIPSWVNPHIEPISAQAESSQGTLVQPIPGRKTIVFGVYMVLIAASSLTFRQNIGVELDEPIDSWQLASGREHED